MMDSKRQNLGAAFRELRTQRGFTQSDLARRAGRTQARVSEMERSHLDPQVSTVLAIADALDAELMLIPRERIGQVRLMMAAPEGRGTPPVRDIFDEVFVPGIAEEPDA